MLSPVVPLIWMESPASTPPAFTLVRPTVAMSSGSPALPMTLPAWSAAVVPAEMFTAAPLPSRMEPPVDVAVTAAPLVSVPSVRSPAA